MARELFSGSHSFTCTPTRSSAIGMSHTCLCLSSYSWYSFTDPGGTDVGLDGWLRYVVRQFTCPKAVTHPITNRAQCRATRYRYIKPIPFLNFALEAVRGESVLWTRTGAP